MTFKNVMKEWDHEVFVKRLMGGHAGEHYGSLLFRGAGFHIQMPFITIAKSEIDYAHHRDRYDFALVGWGDFLQEPHHHESLDIPVHVEVKCLDTLEWTGKSDFEHRKVTFVREKQFKEYQEGKKPWPFCMVTFSSTRVHLSVIYPHLVRPDQWIFESHDKNWDGKPAAEVYVPKPLVSFHKIDDLAYKLIEAKTARRIFAGEWEDLRIW